MQTVGVMVRTRLDTVVRLREREEERAAQEVVKAETMVRAAEERRAQAHARQMQDFRGRHDVSHWEAQELARNRALADEKKAEKEVEQAKQAASQVRAQYVSAHQRAEVVRRVADGRRQEATREENRLEARALDEVATLAFIRKAG